MSRTRVHAPWWTRAPWYVPSHGRWCNRGYVCDLPERPVRHGGGRVHVLTSMCTWNPAWPPYNQMHKLFGCRVPRWYVEHVGHNVERVRERDKLGEMVKEFNATGGIDDGDFPCWQSRHSAVWGWD